MILVDTGPFVALFEPPVTPAKVPNASGGPTVLAALFVLGLADVVSVVIRFSLVQLQTPDEMRGRVSAVNALFIGTSNQLGEFESGAAAALMGVVPSVVFGGCATIVVALIWMWLFPELRRVRRLDG